MRYLIKILFLTITLNYSFSAEYVSNGTATVKISKKILLPDGSYYSTLDTSGSGTNNLGLYEISNCAGHRISKGNKLKEQNFFCNVELSNGHYYTFFMKRSETDTDAGVGYIIIAGGSNPFEKIRNTKCNYAVSFFKDQAYVKIRCDVDEAILKEINEKLI